MLLIAPGDVVATPRSRRSLHRGATADLVATACSGQLANAAQPLPAPTSDAPLPRMVAGVLLALAGWAVFGWAFGSLARTLS